MFKHSPYINLSIYLVSLSVCIWHYLPFPLPLAKTCHTLYLKSCQQTTCGMYWKKNYISRGISWKEKKWNQILLLRDWYGTTPYVICQCLSKSQEINLNLLAVINLWKVSCFRRWIYVVGFRGCWTGLSFIHISFLTLSLSLFNFIFKVDFAVVFTYMVHSSLLVNPQCQKCIWEIVYISHIHIFLTMSICIENIKSHGKN